MRWMITSLAALIAFLGAISPAVAQEQDREAFKKKILEEVEKKLRAQEERILEEIGKIIDRELSKLREPQALPSKPEKAPEPPKAPKPARKARGFLGVGVSSLTPEELEELDIEHGVRISEVHPGGGAEKAGIQVDDVVVSVNGKGLEDPNAVVRAVEAAGVGGKLTLGLLREGKKLEVVATLGRHPAEEATPAPGAEEKSPEELRERMKKFLDKEKEKKEEPKEEEKKEESRRRRGAEPERPALPFGDLFALDEQALEMIRPMLEQYGVDPEQFFEKGDDGKYRLSPEYQGMFEGLFENLPGAEGLFALDEEMFDQVRPMLEQFGVDPEQFFEQGDDGKWRLQEQYRDMMKQFQQFARPPKPPAERRRRPRVENPEDRKEEEKEPAPKSEPGKKKESVSRPAWLGVQIEEIGADLRSQLGLPEGKGLLVVDTLEGSPAREAGIQKNDILLALNGTPVAGEEALVSFLRSSKPGQEIQVTLLRKGEEIVLGVTLKAKGR